jgi:hypothetical protein
MPNIRTRASKGSALTHNELDANFDRTVTQKTTTYQILIGDNQSIIEGNHASSAFTITLPPVATAAASETGEYEVTVTNIGAAIVTVDGSGAETVDNTTGLALQVWGSATFLLDSAQTGWKTVAKCNVLNHIGALTVSGALAVSGSLNVEAYSEDADQYTIGSGTIGLDTALATYFYPDADFGANTPTFTFDNPASSGRVTSFTMELLGADPDTITWPASVDWSGGVEPTWGSGKDIVSFVTRDGGTIWLGFLGGQGFA